MQPVPVTWFHHRGERIVCDVCPVHCALKEGEQGICGGRQVIDGTLIATNYGQVVALHLDPIEKKPLFHFYPGALIQSVGPNGCNFHCTWCQNCEISQVRAPTMSLSPSELADLATRDGSIGLAYTYTEPLIWFETLRDTFPLVRKAGGKNVIVSNGYIEADPLAELLPFIDAANIDLKSTDAPRHMKATGGDVEMVKQTIITLVQAGVHVEITHLLVTGFADNSALLMELVQWVAALDRSIPLHLSRYFPHHRLTEAATDTQFMEQAFELASTHLDFVYLGNVYAGLGWDTFCPSCRTVIIQRQGGAARMCMTLRDGRCDRCGAELNIRCAESGV